MHTKDDFVLQSEAAMAKHSGLHLSFENEIPVLSGEIILFDHAGTLIDQYQVEIWLPKAADRFPEVFETGGRIPKNVDWHVYETTGNCCIKAPVEERIICSGGITLLQFIDEQLTPYLFNQTFRRMNGYFLHERKHGQAGIIDTYLDLFKTDDPNKMFGLLMFVISNPQPGRTADCFCGNGIKYRKCHRDIFRALKMVDPDLLLNDLKLMHDYYKIKLLARMMSMAP